MERIYHTWDKWECYPAGFYESKAPDGMSREQAMQTYAEFLADDIAFEEAAARVIREWPNSCEHYLSNENMNRIAWIGQAAACIALGLPATFRGGFRLMSAKQQARANGIALAALNRWLERRGEPLLKSPEEAESRLKVDLY